MSSTPGRNINELLFPPLLLLYQLAAMPPKPPLTHFLCLPLVTPSSRPQLLASLQHFTADVTNPESEGSISIPTKAVRPIGTLHLTLGVMSLQSLERVAAASRFLRSLDVREMLRGATKLCDIGPVNMQAAEGPKVLPETNKESQAGSLEDVPPLAITLSGLHPMHTPSSTSILYASPLDDTSRLYPFALALQQAFTNAELLLHDDRDLRLHATIVNTIYTKDKKARTQGGGHGKNSRGSRKFDAQEVIAKYEDFEWAKDVHIERLSVCEMGAEKIVEDGKVVNEEYLEIASLPLP